MGPVASAEGGSGMDRRGGFEAVEGLRPMVPHLAATVGAQRPSRTAGTGAWLFRPGLHPPADPRPRRRSEPRGPDRCAALAGTVASDVHRPESAPTSGGRTQPVAPA